MKAWLLPGVLLSWACFSVAPASASPSDTSGVVTFVGAIVEPVCDISTATQQVSVSCFRQGKAHTLAAHDMSRPYALPLDIGSVETITLTATTKVVIVSYE